MLDTLKALLGISDTNSDALLNALIIQAQTFIVDYCNLTIYDTSLDNTCILLVMEMFNKLGSEGISSRNYAGIQEAYNDDFSPSIYKMLNKHRRIRMM